MQSYQKLITKVLFALVPFATTTLRESEFSFLLHLKNKYWNRLNLSNDLRMSLSNCVPRYEWIISEKQQQNVTRFVSNEQ